MFAKRVREYPHLYTTFSYLDGWRGILYYNNDKYLAIIYSLK